MADANRAEVRKKKRVERDAARKSPDPDPAVQSFDPELPGCFDQNLIFATSAYKERESAFKWLSSLRVRGIGLETACDQFAEYLKSRGASDLHIRQQLGKASAFLNQPGYGIKARAIPTKRSFKASKQTERDVAQSPRGNVPREDRSLFEQPRPVMTRTSRRSHIDAQIAPIFRAADAYSDFIVLMKENFPLDLSINLTNAEGDEK